MAFSATIGAYTLRARVCIIEWGGRVGADDGLVENDAVHEQRSLEIITPRERAIADDIYDLS